MDYQAMVKEALSDAQVSAGRALVDRLDAIGFRVASAYWLYEAERNAWALQIVSPVLRYAGPLKVYEVIQSALKEIPALTLGEIATRPGDDPFTRQLAKEIGLTDSDQSQFRRAVVDGIPQDVLIYRLSSIGPLLYNSGWTDQRVGPFGSSLLALRGREILQKLTDLDIAVPPSNRIERAVALTESLNDGRVQLEETNREVQARAKDAARTIWESFVIMHTVLDRPGKNDAIPREALASLLSGRDIGAQDPNQAARSSQFELYVTATLILGGADVRRGDSVQNRGPDLLMLFHGQYIGVEVKLLASARRSRLRDQLRSAAKQLKAAGTRGFVALNLDSWVPELRTNTEVTEAANSFSDQLWDAHAEIVHQSDREVLMGVLIYAHWSRWRFESDRVTLEWHEPRQMLAFTDSLDQVRQASEFFTPLQARMSRELGHIAKVLSGEHR